MYKHKGFVSAGIQPRLFNWTVGQAPYNPGGSPKQYTKKRGIKNVEKLRPVMCV
jgi:hypothetical protein